MDEISFALNPPRFVKSRRNKRPIRIARTSAPVWPLPALNGREPVIVETTTQQPGIELAYSRIAPADAAVDYPPGSPHGTEQHFMPHSAAVLAMDGGVITFAGRLGNAYAMIINHGNGWATHYRNLKSLACVRTDLYSPREQYVHAGKTIGYVGAPAAGEFRRLYFELWKADRDKRFTPVDPRERLSECKLVQHYDRFTPAPPEAQKEAA
jgi:murein DD-endopeptidase MepM/ murein hydrolase activator NlpD